MGSGYTYRMNALTVADMKSYEHRFAKMAERGWMLDKLGQYFHRYQSAEPCTKRFFVDLLPKIGAFDYQDNKEAQEYREDCEELGWTFVAANRQLHVFCVGDDSPVPESVHPDNETQARNFLQVCRRYELPTFFLSVFLICYLLISRLARDGATVLLSDFTTFLLLGYVVFLVAAFWILGFVLIWYLRVSNSASMNRPMPEVSIRSGRARGIALAVCTCGFIACLIIGLALENVGSNQVRVLLSFLAPLAAICAGLLIRRQISSRRRDRSDNMKMTAISVVILTLVLLLIINTATRSTDTTEEEPASLDGRPALTLADIGVESAPDYEYTYVGGSLAAPEQYSYWEAMEHRGEVYTEVFRMAKIAFAQRLYDDFTKAYYSEFMDVVKLSPGEAAYWGADEGVRSDYEDGTRLLLRKDNAVLRLSFSGVATDLDSVSQVALGIW